MSGFNSFLSGIRAGQDAYQHRQSAFNASMMPRDEASVQAPAARQEIAPPRPIQNTRPVQVTPGRGDHNLAQIFAGLDRTQRQEIKADLSRKKQVVGVLKDLPIEEQVLGIETFGKDWGFEDAARQRAAANPAMALTEVSSSIQQAEAMLEPMSPDRRQARPLSNAPVQFGYETQNSLDYGYPRALGLEEPPLTLMAQAVERQGSATEFPREDMNTPPHVVLEKTDRPEETDEALKIGALKNADTKINGKAAIDESIQSLTEEIENTETIARRRSISDAYAEKRLEQYGNLASLKLQKHLKEQGVDILNVDDLGVDKLYPTHPSQKGKNYITLRGKDAVFELPGAIGRYYPKAKARSRVVVNLPLARGGNPGHSDFYLSNDSLYLDGGSRQDANLSLVVLSDLYTDGKGNYYRGYDVRSWIGDEPELWSMGRSNIADTNSAEYAPGGANQIRDSRDSNTSAVDIDDLNVITPITSSDLRKIEVGIDEAKAGFDKVGNIYVRKGN